MTDDVTKRDLKREIETVKTDITEFDFHSHVTIVTEDMTDDSGTLIESEVSEPDLPSGFELGDEIPTESAVVTVNELV